MDYRFRWQDRLHGQREFRDVVKKGRRFSSAGLIIWVYRNPDAARGPRLGLAIPGSFGNAVARNRLKRLLRETFRLNKALLAPGVDMVFSARPMESKLQFQMIEALVKTLWKKAEIL